MKYKNLKVIAGIAVLTGLVLAESCIKKDNETKVIIPTVSENTIDNPEEQIDKYNSIEEIDEEIYDLGCIVEELDDKIEDLEFERSEILQQIDKMKEEKNIIEKSHPLVLNNELLKYYDEVTDEVTLTDIFIKSEEEFNYVLDRIVENRRKLNYYGYLKLTIQNFDLENYSEETKQKLNKFLIDSKNISKLEITGIDLEDLSFLSNISVRNLDLSNNKIEDLTVLSTIKDLEELKLNGNKISDLNPLANQEKLKELSLNNNDVKDLAPLSNLYNLECLDMNDNKISDLTPLSNLFLLYRLSLYNNNITTLNGLEKMYSLLVLDVSGNNVADINGVIPLIKNNDITILFENISDEDYLSIMGVKNSDDDIYIKQKIKGVQ